MRPGLALVLLALVLLLISVPGRAGNLFCDGCGRTIDGKYYTHSGLNLHPDCYTRLYAPRCGQCGAAIEGRYIELDGRHLHPECYQKYYAQYCGVCGGALNGQFLRNAWGDVYCARHADEYKTCEFCGRLICERLTGGGVRYPDGRHACKRCQASAVNAVGDGRLLIDTVKAVLARHGINAGLDFNFHLIDKSEMARLTSSSDRDSWGYTELKRRPGMFGWFLSDRIDMYLLDGMPRVIFMRVLAHELMHVWLFEHAPLDMNHMLVEGSCEYAAYLALAELDDPLARYDLSTQRDNRDLAYGAGFRSVSTYVGEVGVDRWLTYLKGHEDPPW